MNHGSRLVLRSVVGMLLFIAGLAGCDAGGSAPVTGGAGIPKNRGPVSSKMPKPGEPVKSNPVGPRARRAAPAPTQTENP